MTKRLPARRLRELFEGLPRTTLNRLARAAALDIRSFTPKDDLLDALIGVPAAGVHGAMAAAITAVDLRQLCGRLGYSQAGGAAALAGRLLAAVADPDARISRWRTFTEARDLARTLGLRSQAEWYAFARGALPGVGRRPDDVPKAPHLTYANAGWTTWGDFLGTGNPARHLIRYRPYARGRAFARRLGLPNAAAWRALAKKRVGNRRVLPPDIPAAPEAVYAGAGWLGYGDWLGTGVVHASRIVYRTYKASRAFARSLGIRSETEWRAYCRGQLHRDRPRPRDIPSNPQRT